MKAIVIPRFGGPEVLELREVPDPAPQRGEVLVRVRATAVNRADLLQRMGGYKAPADSPQDIPGLEYAGEVEAVGEAVSEWRPGDRVFGLVGGGSYAEKLVAPARTLARMPDALSFTDGAALPEATITAYDAMVTQARLAAGETVLIHAVGSGVGTAAVQLARAIGARSIGTARTSDKLDRARALGLDEGLVPQGGKFAAAVKALGPIDVVLDLVGGPYVAEDVACIAPKGRIMVVGLVAGPRVELDLNALLTRRASIAGTVLRARPLEEKAAAMQIFARHVVPLVAAGRVRAVIDRVLPLAAAAEAHSRMGDNETFGKLVLET